MIETVQLSDRLIPSSDVVAREVAGETVLLDLASGTYFGLNDVGSVIWRWLEGADAQSLAGISEQLARDYAIADERAQHDVLTLARALAEHGLVTVPDR